MPALARLPRLALVTSCLAATLVLAGCSALQAQNPSGALRPVNAVADGDDARVMLAGADVVAYFTQGRFVQGSPQFESVHEGVTFRFSTQEHKAAFDAAPSRYLPQYGGYCTNGIVYGIPWGGDADAWRVIDGKLYIFGGRASLEAFELDVPGNLRLAEKYWREEVSGRNSFVQRAWRLTVRVPHYRSGEELARAVAESRGQRQP